MVMGLPCFTSNSGNDPNGITSWPMPTWTKDGKNNCTKTNNKNNDNNNNNDDNDNNNDNNNDYYDNDNDNDDSI